MTTGGLKTPRSAALAGILFAVLYSSSVALIRSSVPENFADSGTWLRERAGAVTLALNLMPFSGIAFLWFIGVVRDRIGQMEDRFLSTVVLGSGLLFLALTFVSAALAGGILVAYAVDSDRLISSGLYTLVRAVMLLITSTYAVKMAGVFMISLATLSARTEALPRWMIVLTYAVALGLLLSVSSHPWVLLSFPAWVFAVSVFILVSNLRGRPAPP